MTDNRTTELLPCPFCGGEADVMLSQSRWGQSYTIHHDALGKCPAEYVGSMQFATEAEAIAAWNARAELGSEPPYDELLRCLENDWHIHASWDGLRKFWCIELTEEGVKLRDAYDEALRRIAALEELVWFMVPFFDSAVSHECGCPDGYFEPHGCDDGCKALKELDERMKELGIEVDR